MEKISILIPVYNREAMITQCITNLLKQTYKDIQILIYDDGSTDDTLQMVRSKFASQDVKIYSGEHGGVGFARNKLLDFCDTRLAVWQDSDDFSNIHRIRLLFTEMEKVNKPIVNSGWHSWNRGPETHRGELVWSMKPQYDDRDRVAFATIMFQTDATLRFKEDVFVGEDTIWRREMKNLYGDEHIVHHQLYYIRWHAERLGMWAKQRRCKCAVLR